MLLYQASAHADEGALNVQAIQSRVCTVITTADINSGCQVMSLSAQFLFFHLCA